MLSSDWLTDTDSMASFLATTSSHSWVRAAVFPARNMATPNPSNASTASSGGEKRKLALVARCEVTLDCDVPSDVRPVH